TTFGGKNLLDGTLKGESFQVGSNAGETLSFSIGDMSAKGLSGQATLAEFEGGAAAVADVEDDGTVTADGFDAAGKLITAAGDGVSIKLNGTIVSFEEGDTLDKVVDKINNASTGVTAAKNEGGDGIVLTSLQDFTVEEGEPAGREVLGLDEFGNGDDDGIAAATSHTIDSLDILTAGNAQLAIQALDDAIASVDSTRADLGAVQ